jgi:hypothetical protein
MKVGTQAQDTNPLPPQEELNYCTGLGAHDGRRRSETETQCLRLIINCDGEEIGGSIKQEHADQGVQIKLGDPDRRSNCRDAAWGWDTFRIPVLTGTKRNRSCVRHGRRGRAMDQGLPDV